MFKNIKVSPKVTRALGDATLFAKKHAPEIAMGVGTVTFVGTIVTAVNAKTKAETVLEQAEKTKQAIEEAKYLETYTEEDEKKDRIIMVTNMVVGMVKAWGPTIILGSITLGCFYGGNIILNKRNAALMTAYASLSEGYEKLKRNVAEEFGEEKLDQLVHGVREEIITEKHKDENGKTVTEKRTVENVNPENIPSPYARIFDEYSTQWTNDPNWNMSFLVGVQNRMNDQLYSRGHVFLNEVYDLLDVPRSPEGALVGWKLQEGKDNFIDLGLYDVMNDSMRNFVNGRCKGVLLDFNVDGIIYDLI